VSDSDRVRIEIEGGVADVRLNRPEKLNALDLAMFEALVDAARALGGDPALRAVVLSGEGRAFCAGLDFASFQAMGGPDAARGRGPGAAASSSATAPPRRTWRSGPPGRGPSSRCP